MGVHTIDDLRQMQALPLSLKVRLTKSRIRQWVNEFGEEGTYISFSGGKDSTVLLHLVREEYPNIPAVFVDTGLEFPEIREFVRTVDNVIWVKPKMNFKKVIETYGYPFISKEVSQKVYETRQQAEKAQGKVEETSGYIRNFDENSEYCKKYPTFCIAKFKWLFDAPFDISNRCCNVMKKQPSKDYEKETGRKPFIGTMASESNLRTSVWLQYGCNAFGSRRQKSAPMSFWTEQDVLLYIKENNLPICSVYGDIAEDGELVGQMTMSDFDSNLVAPKLKTTGCDRTGCMFCGYGCHLEKEGEGRFERMKQTHPKQYAYIMKPWNEGGLGYKEVIDWMNEHGNLHIRY